MKQGANSARATQKAKQKKNDPVSRYQNLKNEWSK